ncbi:hypothetical protein JCM33374_g6396 [Metschnikowia sp. JCM 33374]|nr:hypothetical protein JCM33374_g6396 [Metschnikowia sp. JCM 33374]
MSNLESIRKQNIERNKELLKKLNLASLSASITSDIKPKNKVKTQPKVKVNKPLPTRRSKRLAKDPEDEKDRALQEDIANKELLAQQQLRESRLSKLKGDFNIQDLLAEHKSGNLVAEEYILGIQNSRKTKTDSKIEIPELDARTRYDLSVIKEMGTKVSDQVQEVSQEAGKSKSNLTTTKKEFSKLELHSLTDPSKVKLTPHRITSILFHPSTTERLAFAGDTNGTLGIWAIDQKTQDNEPVIVLAKPHGRTISKIIDVPQNPIHIITGSYDGSCRVLDLSKQVIVESFSMEDTMGVSLGISDINCASPNMLYVTTLSGHLFKHDTRQSSKSIKYEDLLRLHDKKIGGFCINPSSEHQIATASLDRSLKIWDLRSVSKRNSHSEILDGLSSPQSRGAYSSRLSISNVDWNMNQRIVCNGYDDTIRLFDVSSYTDAGYGIRKRGQKRPPPEQENLEAQTVLKHNCQTGRWVSILKSRWQRSPRDGIQKFAIGNMNRSIDIYAEDGHQIANLAEPGVMTAVPAVVTFHPTANWVLGGNSSGKVFLFN